VTVQIRGITGYGAYVPRWRIDKQTIARAHKWMAPALMAQAKGARSFCNWDEDAITMAVEAVRDACPAPGSARISRLYAGSTNWPFDDLQNSSLVAAAAGLGKDVQTLDLAGSQRMATAGILAALDQDARSMLVVSDRPRALPASAQEVGYGAGAGALTFGAEGVIATMIGSASSREMFNDHVRGRGADSDFWWEERWVRDEGYLKLVPDIALRALESSGVRPGEVTHFILPSALGGIASAVARKLGVRPEAEADSLHARCGYAGAAHGLLMLACVLEKARPGDRILMVGFGQGCDALVLHVTDQIDSYRPARGVAAVLADALLEESYMRLAAYEGFVKPDWGMRSEKPVKSIASEQYRSAGQVYGFRAGRCGRCGTVQFPQLPICVNPQCHAPEAEFTQVSLAPESGEVLTITADWLSYHPAPPLYVGFVAFANGARLMMEIADVARDSSVEVGTPVRMIFRIKDYDTTRKYPRYFWKATPATNRTGSHRA